VKSLAEELAKRDRRIQELEDIEAIKRLQCAYGYYLEHWMGPEIVDCFSRSPEAEATFVEGTYKGQEGIRRYFNKGVEMPPTFLHMVLQVSPVITLEPDGIHAHGRWWGYGTILSRLTEPLDPSFMSVVYEMDYIKEDGIWKILVFRLMMTYAYNYGLGKPVGEVVPETQPENIQLSPDVWAEFDTQYPSGYIYPMHFVHPVTGKPTTEAIRNARLKLKPSPFLPKK
jgi:hypothetical protein